ATFAQARIGEERAHVRQQRRGRRRKVVRDQLLQQIGGELGKLVLELELHARGQERGALEQAGHHRIHAVGDQAAQTFGDAWIFGGEIARLLMEQLQFAIVEVEEFPVHGGYSRPTEILPLSSSRSATNSTGTFNGSHNRSARTMKRTLSSASSISES